MFELVRCATVPIRCTADLEHLGTGFFAAPGMALTAAHVVAEFAGNPRGVELEVLPGLHKPCTSVVLLATRREQTASYPWPDVAILEVDHDGHPCVRLGREWPPFPNPDPWLYAWAHAREYDSDVVGGTSVPLTYAGPAVQSAPPRAPGQKPPEVLKLTGDRIIPGMSGAPVLDVRKVEVVAIMKRTRDERASEGGYATAIADVLDLAGHNPVVARLIDAHDAHHKRHDHAAADANTRWGRLLDDVAELIETRNVARAVARELTSKGHAVELDALEEPELSRRVATAMFDTDVETLALIVSDLADRRILDGATALELFDNVACCLPVMREPSGDPDRPIEWWVAPEAAEQLSHLVRAPAPRRRVALVAADNRETVEMLARRASRRERLMLHHSDVLTDYDTEPDSFLEHVETVIREIAPLDPGWQTDPDGREFARKWVNGKGKLIPLGGKGIRPSDLDQLLQEFGDLPYVLWGREVDAPLADSPDVLRIRPEIDARQEKAALQWRRPLQAGAGES